MSSADPHPFARASSRPFSLPPIHPLSPIVLSFDTFTGKSRHHRSSAYPPSPSSPTPSPSYDEHAPLSFSHAVKGSRTAAELIRILDLKVQLEDLLPVGSRDMSSMSSPDTIPIAMDGTPADNTPETSFTSPSQSFLTRANMTKLRDATRTTKRAPSPRTPPTIGSPVLRRRLASPVDFSPPPKAVSKRSTIDTQSSYGPIQSVRSEDLHLSHEPPSTELAWPEAHCVYQPDSMSQLPLYAAPPLLLEGRHHDSFLRLGSRNGSDTYDFPAPATEIESDYSPSMAAPSSVRRRVAKWTTMQEPVLEEVRR